MSAVLKTILLCHGWDVLCEVNGKPFTFTFPTEPTQDQIDERIDAVERQLRDEVSEQIVTETEELD